MAEPIRRLPDAELEVMQALWACGGPATRVVCISCAPATLGYMAQWAEVVGLFPRTAHIETVVQLSKPLAQ